MFRSLTGKILIVIVLLILVCTTAFASVSYVELKRSVTSQMKSDGTALITNIKNEIIKYKVLDLQELQGIFKDIKEQSGNSISYISLSDAQSNVIVSDSALRETGGGSEGEGQASGAGATDATSSASAKGNVAEVVNHQTTLGQMLKTASGEEVYNVSTDFTYNSDLSGALNVGISLTSMQEQIRRSLMETLLISLAIMVLAIFIGTIAARRMIRPLVTMSKGIKEFAKGDFTVGFEYKGRDEIGAISGALNQMREALSRLVGDIQRNAHKIAASSQECTAMIAETTRAVEGISSATGELAGGAENLANYSQDGMDRLNVLADEIQLLAQQADFMKERTRATREANQVGLGSIRELLDAINDNARVTEGIAEQVEDLGLKSERISQITTVIKEIAEQTKLLALNAMIESARAGEQGRGFSVVAEEIRKLSEQTGSSVDNIEGIVAELGAAVAKTRDYMERGSQAIDRTNGVSAQTGRSFKQIGDTVAHIVEEIERLIQGIEQTNRDKNELVGAIGSIAAIAQEANASTEEIAASVEQQMSSMEYVSGSAEELKRIATRLEELIGHFKLM